MGLFQPEVDKISSVVGGGIYENKKKRTVYTYMVFRDA